MAWPAGSRASDFWSDDFGVGAAETWTFEGREGLQRLHGPQRISAPDPAAFDARLTRVQLDHVALEHFQATAHVVERGDAEIAAYPTPLLTVVLVLRGLLQVEVEGVAFSVASGQAAVLDSRERISVSSASELEVLRSVVGVEHVPDALRRAGATVPGALPRTPLVDSFGAFVATVLRSTRQNQHPRGLKLIDAVAELQAAVLAEAQAAAAYPQGPEGLRYRIEEQVEQRHTDPRLDVAAIARAVGVSVRHAHEVFDDGERTIGRVLRERRVTTAAALLRTADGAVRLSDIAAAAGFAEREALNRAFRWRYGMSAADYHRGGHRSLD